MSNRLKANNLSQSGVKLSSLTETRLQPCEAVFQSAANHIKFSASVKIYAAEIIERFSLASLVWVIFKDITYLICWLVSILVKKDALHCWNNGIGTAAKHAECYPRVHPSQSRVWCSGVVHPSILCSQQIALLIASLHGTMTLASPSEIASEPMNRPWVSGFLNAQFLEKFN